MKEQPERRGYWGRQLFLAAALGLGLATNADATAVGGVQLGVGDSAIFKFDFGSVNLSSTTVIAYVWTVTDLNALPVTLWEGSVGAYDELPPGAPDFTSPPSLSYNYQLDKYKASYPGFFDDPISYVNVQLTAAVDNSGASISSVLMYITAYAKNNGDVVAFVEGTSVPEPATLALFGLGLAGIPFVRRRRTPE